MKVAIYGRNIQENFITVLKEILFILKENNIKITFYEMFYKSLNQYHIELEDLSAIDFFVDSKTLSKDVDLFISIGGDGTFLETLPFILESDIPVVGVNLGKLGFLANISKEEISSSFKNIFNRNYQIEHRIILQLIEPSGIFNNQPYALNDITIQKHDLSMISIDVYLNNEYLNTYWTDGLIISTPTGSTAYSLSAGGPIVSPDSSTFILAPIASHNLSVRPIIIPDNYEIKINVSSKINKFLITADHKTSELSNPVEIKIKKSEHKIKTLLFPENSFFKTLRNKLMWGIDKRNY